MTPASANRYNHDGVFTWPRASNASASPSLGLGCSALTTRCAMKKRIPVLVLLAIMFMGLTRLNSGEHGSGDAVNTEPGMNPFTWPKRLVSLEFGKEVRYRKTEYRVLAFLKDGDAYLQVKQGEEIVSKLWLWDGGQFGILDVDTPMPMLEGWGERYDGLAARWLILPARNAGLIKYEFSYIEFYTPNKGEALASQAHEIQLRTNATKRAVYFLGHHTSFTQKQATERFKDALKLPKRRSPLDAEPERSSEPP